MRTAFAAAVVAFLLGIQPGVARSTETAVGAIPLVDQNGASFRLRSLAGRPAVITFVATRCQDTCPIVNAVFSQLQRNGVPASLVTISLDPGYDTPIVLANVSRELHARAPAWRFLTGRPADVAHVLAAFGVTVEKDAGGIPDAHSDFVYVLDARGSLRETLPLSNHTAADVRRAIALAR